MGDETNPSGTDPPWPKNRRTRSWKLTRASNFLRGTIAEELARDTPKFSSDDAGLLKFHGTYQQDDRDARKQREAGAGRSYIFMVRIKVPGGKLTAEQFLTELSLGERLGNGTLRITTRQGFQLQGRPPAGRIFGRLLPPQGSGRPAPLRRRV